MTKSQFTFACNIDKTRLHTMGVKHIKHFKTELIFYINFLNFLIFLFINLNKDKIYREN